MACLFSKLFKTEKGLLMQFEEPSQYVKTIGYLGRFLYPFIVLLLAMVFWKLSQQLKLKPMLVLARIFFYFFFFTILCKCLWTITKPSSDTQKYLLWLYLIATNIIQLSLFVWVTSALLKQKKNICDTSKEATNV